MQILRSLKEQLSLQDLQRMVETVEKNAEGFVQCDDFVRLMVLHWQGKP